jgi:hypothetical protein
MLLFLVKKIIVMKQFADLTEDNLEQIRTKIENTLRDQHHLFLGFFPDVMFVRNNTEDDLVFNIRTQKVSGEAALSSLLPDLSVMIGADFSIRVSGTGTEGIDGPEIVDIIKSVVKNYLVEEGFTD